MESQQNGTQNSTAPIPTSNVTPAQNQLVYGKESIGIATLFFGPFAGCYMAAKNFKLFGNEKAAKNMWLTIFISFIIFVLLPLPKALNYGIGIGYLVGIYSYVNEKQKKNINDCIATGGKKYSAWKVIAVSCAALLLTLFGIVILVIIKTILINLI